MPAYTTATLISMLVVILIELFWLRTRIFRSAQFWVSLAIMFSFQILVDGWLTKLSDPIVIYEPTTMLGIRFPWDIPVEDFGFGFAMLTLTIMLWKRFTRSDASASGHNSVAPATEASGTSRKVS